MAISFSVVTLVAALTLALFLSILNFFFWSVQREDRTPLWLAAWLTACALFTLCRLLQYASLSEPMYIVVPRILLTAGYSLAWLGYELGNTFISYRPPRWERALFIFLVTIPIMLLWTSHLILTDQVVIRTVMFGGEFHGVRTGFLYLPVGLMNLVLGAVPPIRLIRASGPHKRENLLMALGYLFVIFFSLNDYIAISLSLVWIRLTDFSYLPMPIFFSYIQVQRFGRLYREMNVMVHERTAELSQANETLRAEIIERKQAEREREKLIIELEVRNAESETLREGIALVVGTLDLTEIVVRILDQIKRVVPFDSASVWEVDGNMQKIIGGEGLPSELSFPDEGIVINENNSALPLLEGKHPYMLYDDVQLGFAGFREPPHNYIHSWLGIPLKVRGKIIGLIALDGRSKNQFNHHHAELAVTFANQVAIALENARLFSNLQSQLEQRRQLIAELEAKNAEAKTLRESTAIVAATLEFPETIRRILEQLKQVVVYDSASVWLIEGNVSRIIMGSDGLHSEIQIPGMEYIINEQEPDYPLLTQDLPYILYDDIQIRFPQFNDPISSYIHGWLAIPLRVHGKLIGSIFLDSRMVGHFTENDAQKAVTYANQVAIALENSRLFSELQNELLTREKLIKELESKNAELERFTYTVSHDLKSPLVTMKGFLGYLEQDVVTGNVERLKSDTQRIANAVDKMGQLLNDVLELSRIGRFVNPSENVPFEELTREAIDLVKDRIQECGITVELQPNLLSVYGDKPRLIEVLQNLLDNAAKYMGDQTSPTIEIGMNVQEASDNPVFFVRDNGIGIAPEYHERVFGLFNKLDARSEGTGIGLALVRRIIEFHGGQIWVESNLGKGTTFFFTLPSQPKSDSVI